MHYKGWFARPNVTILPGRWQDWIGPTALNKRQLFEDVLGENDETGDEHFDIGSFDVIYFDTFEESYENHLQFFMEVPRLLSGPNARFCAFQGILHRLPMGNEVSRQM